ncbi:MAG: hypothetical protein WCS70_02910 [Verrucomicrobiota bacterium]
MNILGKPIHAILGLLLMAVGVAVCDTGFIGFLLAAPFVIAGFVFCMKSAMAMVNRELPKSRRIIGAFFVVIGIVLLVMSFGQVVDTFGPVGRSISQHRYQNLFIRLSSNILGSRPEEAWNPVTNMRALTWEDLGIWLAPPVVIVLGQRLRSKAAWRQLLVSVAYWAAYFPFVAGIFILFAILGWPSGN